MRKLILLFALSSLALFGQFSNAKKLQGRLICIDAPSDGNSLTWSASRVCWVAASGGSGSQSIQVDAVAIGTRSTVNFITAAGITWTAADTGSKINLTPAVDTAFIARHLDVASGVDLSVTPASNSGSAYTGCQASITPGLTTGMVVHLIPDHASTGGATTFNYCGGGALSLKKADGTTNPTATDIISGQELDLWYDGSIWRIKRAGVTRSIGFAFDGGGSALTTAAVGYVAAPFACVISGWDMTVDTGTATIDVWKIATGSAIPTVSNTIAASALPAIASGTALRSTTLTGWTTSVTAFDLFGFKVNAVSGATRISIVLECVQ